MTFRTKEPLRATPAHSVALQTAMAMLFCPARLRRALSVISAKERSEEHTSELQSLMRISYAVFCLKKKIHIHTIYTTPNTRKISDRALPASLETDKTSEIEQSNTIN